MWKWVTNILIVVGNEPLKNLFPHKNHKTCFSPYFSFHIFSGQRHLPLYSCYCISFTLPIVATYTFVITSTFTSAFTPLPLQTLLYLTLSFFVQTHFSGNSIIVDILFIIIVTVTIGGSTHIDLYEKFYFWLSRPLVAVLLSLILKILHLLQSFLCDGVVGEGVVKGNWYTACLGVKIPTYKTRNNDIWQQGSEWILMRRFVVRKFIVNKITKHHLAVIYQ